MKNFECAAATSIWLQRLGHALLPPQCPGCDTPSIQAGLCSLCLADLKLAKTDDRGDACYAYSGILARLIRRAKFQPSSTRAAACIPIWETAIQQEKFSALREETDGITYVPSHWRRRLWRGFDLSALLAQALAKTWDLPCFSLLQCTRLQSPLARVSSREKRFLVAQGRFQVRKQKKEVPKNLVLVDDIITSGATLRDVQGALSRSGFKSCPLIFAQTPQEAKGDRGRQSTAEVDS